MHVRDQLIKTRPLARAAALGRQAAHVRRARPAVLLPDARADNLGCLCAPPEQQRQRLCRELHDGLGPTLAGLTLGLDTAHALSAGQPDLQQLLSKLKTETQRAVAEVRRIVYGRPPVLELGLAGALREEVRRLQCEAPALAISLAVPRVGLASLPAPVELACYRIVAEALANVARHAQALRCSVRLHLDHAICVDVRDDGVGLAEGWRPGVGIASMRERVTELGGELVIEPSLPRGTRIAARLPVQEQP
jgi:two-component system, NarL family, sensor kinase